MSGHLPKFYEDKSITKMVLRAAEDIPTGTEIQEKHLASAEVGNFGLPDDSISDKTLIIGKIAQTDIAVVNRIATEKNVLHLYRQSRTI